MTWCDKLASTPTAGIKLSPHHVPTDLLLASIAPILDSNVAGDDRRFALEQPPDFGINLVTDDGYRYRVDPYRMSVDFEYRLRLKNVSGAPPTVEMLSHAAPYSELLTECCKRVQELATLIVGARPRTLEQLGVVTTTRVAASECPPGILRLVDYLGRPWQNAVADMMFNVTASLGETDLWKDRCIHRIEKPQKPDDLYGLRFDFQRTFKNPKHISPDAVRGQLEAMREVALQYFEELAEGDRFDVEVINSNASK